MATSRFLRFFQTAQLAPIIGANIWVKAQEDEDAYPTGYLLLQAHPSRPGTYYRDGLPVGEYKIYMDTQGGTNPSLYEEHIWVGENELTGIADRFDENLRLVSDGIQDGAVTAAKLQTALYADLAKVSKWARPRLGLQLNGTTQYVHIPSSTALNFETGNFSIEHVFELTSVPTATRWIMAKGGGSAAPGYGILLSNQGTGSLVLNLQDETGSQTWLIAPAGSVVANTLYHLVVSIDRGGDATCYLNGTAVGSATVSSVSRDLVSTQPLVFGGFSTGGDLTAQKIYHTRLFNSALTLSEVTALWNNGKPWESFVDYTEAGVVYESGIFGANCVFDVSGQGNHGNVLPTAAVSLSAGIAREYKDGTIDRSSNWAPEGIIPAGYLLKRIIFHNTSVSSCTINAGSTTSGSTDVVNGAVVAGGAIVTAEINKLFSFTAAQNLYFESSSWQTMNIHLIMEKQ